MDFYDAHAHCIENQIGGFIIALEGEPHYGCSYNNSQVRSICKENSFMHVEYVTKDFNPTQSSVIKYHPRRERYSKEEIINDIRKKSPKIVIIDTLYNPFYHYGDYWEIVSSFKEVFFVLAHCGGYDIDDFIKIIDFNINVFTDFSLTQEYFGVVDNQAFLKIKNTMEYMLNNKKINRKILFGSDNPFYSQKKAYDYYFENGLIKMLNDNFLRLIDQANI